MLVSNNPKCTVYCAFLYRTASAAMLLVYSPKPKHRELLCGVLSVEIACHLDSMVYNEMASATLAPLSRI